MNRACVLLPEWKRCVASAQVANGILSYWLARGDRLESRPSGIEQAIRELFEFSGRTFPAAALSRQVDVGDAVGSAWLRADPAHVRADMTTARMLACGELGLTASETDTIANQLRDGIRIISTTSRGSKKRRIPPELIGAALRFGCRLLPCGRRVALVGSLCRLSFTSASLDKSFLLLRNVFSRTDTLEDRATAGAVQVRTELTRLTNVTRVDERL